MIYTSLFDGKRKGKTLEILSSLGIDVISGSAVEQLPVILQSTCPNQPVLIVTDGDNDSIPARDIKNALYLAGVNVSLCIFSGEKEERAVSRLLSCGENFRCIIAVGGEDTINACRFYAGLKDKFIFAVPNTVRVENILPPYVAFTANGFPENVKSKAVDLLFLDRAIYSKCKKHDLADAFSSIVGKCLTLVDYKYACTFEKKSLSPTAYNYYVEAINDAINITLSSEVCDSLLKAELKISLAKSISDIDEYSAQKSVGIILRSMDKEVSMQEAEFVAFVRLVKLYKLFIDNLDTVVLNSPNFCQRINEIPSYLGVRVKDVLPAVKDCTAESERRGKEVLREIGTQLLGELNRTILILGRIKDFKKQLCNPKKPMNKYNSLQIKKSIVLGSYTSEKPTILKLMNTSGFCELLD